MQYGDITRTDEYTRLPAPYVGTFTRDMTLATGTQAITSIGFRPTAIQFISAKEFTISYSSGFSGGNTSRSWGLQDDTTDAWHDPGNGVCIYVRTSSSDGQAGSLNSFDADGFTIGWLKQGTPTGTLRVSYIAYK